MFFFLFFFFFFFFERESELCRAREKALEAERENFTRLGFQSLGFLGKNVRLQTRAKRLLKSIISERAQRAAIIIIKEKYAPLANVALGIDRPRRRPARRGPALRRRSRSRVRVAQKRPAQRQGKFRETVRDRSENERTDDSNAVRRAFLTSF